MRRRFAPAPDDSAKTGVTAVAPGAAPRRRFSQVPPARRRFRRPRPARAVLAAVTVVGMGGLAAALIWDRAEPTAPPGKGQAPEKAAASAPEPQEAAVIADRPIRPVAAASAVVPPPPAVPRTLAASGWSEGIDRRTVVAIQRHLAALGFRPGRTDGTVDPQTRKAIRRFQAFADLPETGAPSVGLRKELAALRKVRRD